MQESIGSPKPFLLLNRPIILEKKLSNLNKLIYIYMAAHLSLKKISDNGDYIERYVIYFSDLTGSASKRRGYNGYSIDVRKYDEQFNLSLNNADGIGLDVRIEPIGIGIGSIVLNHLFYWAKENYPSLEIPRINLSPVDDRDEDNRRRRDRLYEKIGLIGRKAKYISELTPSIESRDFIIHDAYTFTSNLLNENINLKSKNANLEKKVRNLEHLSLKDQQTQNGIFFHFTNLIFCIFFFFMSSLFLFLIKFIL